MFCLPRTLLAFDGGSVFRSANSAFANCINRPSEYLTLFPFTFARGAFSQFAAMRTTVKSIVQMVPSLEGR